MNALRNAEVLNVVCRVQQHGKSGVLATTRSSEGWACKLESKFCSTSERRIPGGQLGLPRPLQLERLMSNTVRDFRDLNAEHERVTLDNVWYQG